MRALSLADISPQQGGGAAGSIAGSFLPFPGGSQIGGLIGSLLGGAIGGKPSNSTAYAWFTAGPNVQPMPGGVSGKACQSNVCGDEKTPQTATLGAQLTVVLMQLVSAAMAAGHVFHNPPFVVTIGMRDASGILHADHSGQWYQQGIGNPGDPMGAAQGAFLWLSQFASPPLTAQVPGQWYQQGSVAVPVAPPSFYAPEIGATDPLPYGYDYNSVQAQPIQAPVTSAAPAGASDTTAPAGSATLAGMPLALLGGVPLALLGGVVVLALLLGDDK